MSMEDSNGMVNVLPSQADSIASLAGAMVILSMIAH